MPNYTFISVENEFIEKDFFFSMKEVPIYGAIIKDEDGKSWKRIPTIPYTASNTKVDPFSKTEFSNQFENKKVKIGDITDASAEASAIREQKLGSDPVKTQFFDNYKKKRKGINHPDDPRPKEAARKKVQEHIDKTFRMPASV